MKKEGFTLVELLGVLTILAIVSVLVFPNVAKIIDRSKNNSYNSQVVTIEMAAKSWATDNMDLLDTNHLNANYISIDFLMYEKFLENSTIMNPLTKEEMEGCITIKYDNATSQYIASYNDLTCIEYTDSIDAKGIIRTIENGTVKIEEKNIIVSAFDKVLEDNPGLYDNSNTSDGLYKIGDNYIFRGMNVNNYVKIGINSFRIISMDSSGIKLMKTTAVSTSYGDTDFLSSNIASSLLSDLASIDSEVKERLVNMDLYVGEVDSSSSLSTLESSEKSKTISNNTSLINISDYVNASTSSTCRKNFTSATCSVNNYLYTDGYNDIFKDKSVWTMDVNGAERWIIANGIPVSHTLNEQSDIIYKAYLTIKINQSFYIEQGIGTSSSPYILK